MWTATWISVSFFHSNLASITTWNFLYVNVSLYASNIVIFFISNPYCFSTDKETGSATAISPTKSVLSSVSCILTDASHISIVEGSVEEMEELPPQEFYKMVTTEQNLVTGKTGEKFFRWKKLHKESNKKHPYFEKHTTEQVRSRFKYIRSQVRLSK